VVAAACALLAACSSSTPAPTPPLGTATPSAATPTPSASTAPTPTATARLATLAQCPGQPAGAAALPILYRGGSPDDVTADPAGGMWVSDTGAGTVYHVTAAAGAVDITRSGFSSPEGMVLLANGDLLVAEQGRNQITSVRSDGSRSVFATLTPPGNGMMGVDGIGFDSAANRVLIPDSPHGTLLVAPAATGNPLAQLAAGLGRPVDAAVGPDGALYVTSENAAPRGLLRVAAGGAVATVGSLRELDDIVALGGLLYVTDLAAGAVYAVDPASGAQRTLVTGLGQPQGLTPLPGGRLAVTDSNSGTVRALPAC
jgi:sugar lactone lactonase YvrE